MPTTARSAVPVRPSARRRSRRLLAVLGVAGSSLFAVVAPAGAIRAPGADDPDVEVPIEVERPEAEDAPVEAPVDDPVLDEDPATVPSDPSDPSGPRDPSTIPSDTVVLEPAPADPVPGPDPGWTVPDPDDLPDLEVATPGDFAPTADLAMVADAISIRHRSVSAELVVASHLTPSVPIEVLVDFGQGFVSWRTYDPAGLVFEHTYAELDGAARTEDVEFALFEQVPGGRMFEWTLQVEIEPLYDVVVGALRFNLFSDCDIVGESEPRVFWRAADGTNGRQDLGMYAGEERILWDFGGHWPEASVADDLREPTIVWDEDDPSFGFGIWIPGTSETRLLPGGTREIAVSNTAENDEGCHAYLRYTVRILLNTYDAP